MAPVAFGENQSGCLDGIAHILDNSFSFLQLLSRCTGWQRTGTFGEMYLLDRGLQDFDAEPYLKK